MITGLKKSAYCAALCMLVLLFAACSQTGEQPGDPVSVAKQAVSISLAYDLDGLSALSCEQMRTEIADQRADFEETMNILKGMGVDLSQVRYDMSGVTFELMEQNEFTAKVRMGGVLTVKVPGLPEESQEQNQEIELRKEEGNWLVCSEIQS